VNIKGLRNIIKITITNGLVVLAIILTPLSGISAMALSPENEVSVEKRSDVPAGLSQTEWGDIQQSIQQAEYQFTWHEPSAAYTAPNHANGFQVAFRVGGVELFSGDVKEDWKWSLVLTGYGIPGKVKPMINFPEMSVDRNRIEYRWLESLTEWYVNDQSGVEQGFTITAPPAGSNNRNLPILLQMTIDTNLDAVLAKDARSVSFSSQGAIGWQSGREVLRYGNLLVIDASGKELPARLDLAGCKNNEVCRLQIVIDAQYAKYPITVDPIVYHQVAKLTPADLEDNDNYSGSVDIDGDVLVVGADYEGYVGPGTGEGVAYVFERNQDGLNEWGQVKKLIASDSMPTNFFGSAVAIDGDTIVSIAVDGDGEVPGFNGAAYVFERNQGGADNWGEVKKISGHDTVSDDYFGASVSIDGDYIVVGAPYAGGVGSEYGGAYVFERNHNGDDNWGEVAKLTASDPGLDERFGNSVSISFDTIVVGAYKDDGMGSGSGAAYVFKRNQGGADAWDQVKKLIASDPVAGDAYGYSVAASGDTIVVGAAYKDGEGDNLGAAYIYERNQGGADNWGQVTKLMGDNPVDADRFGSAVDINGDTLIVGSAYVLSAEVEYVFVFERNSGGAENWGCVYKLTASDGEVDDDFGIALAISGDSIIVGAPFEDGFGDDRGAAYIFTRLDGKWQQVAKPFVLGGENYDYFGQSVDISGSTLVVGAYNADVMGSNQGVAYVYERNQNGGDNWGLRATLTASDAEDNDFFGRSVAISGDTIVVGANYEDGVGGNNCGAAYVFQRNKNGADYWDQVAKLTASDAQDGDAFGGSVAISNGRIIVGAKYEDGASSDRGAAYIFERNQGGADNWGEVKKLVAFAPADNDQFGSSVGIDGDIVVVGALYEDGDGTDRGAAYVYTRNYAIGNSWSFVAKLIASDPEDYDFFGFSVAIDNDLIVIGAKAEDGVGGIDRGAAYLYGRNQGGVDSWDVIQKLTASDAQDYDSFGQSVAIYTDTIVVGAPSEDGEGSNRGSVYVFERNIGGADSWGEMSRLVANDTEDQDWFGYSVAITDGVVISGAYGEDVYGTDRGAAYIFKIGPYTFNVPLILFLLNLM
jgi:hypothetical protein